MIGLSKQAIQTLRFNREAEISRFVSHTGSQLRSITPHPIRLELESHRELPGSGASCATICYLAEVGRGNIRVCSTAPEDVK